MNQRIAVACTATLVVLLNSAPATGQPPQFREIDMRPHWDDSIPLENPHKGWYHHFPDNHPDKYVIAEDSDLLDFPGMDHLYIRLAWSYLEPKEVQFDWSVIDTLTDKWVAHGLGIAFRISCKETSTDRIEQQFATPRWVMEAGARGGHYYRGKATGPDGPWEPVFDDPVFLEKLENFLRAFATRYDGKPWLRYVDVGSIGDWGEGHTSSGSQLHYGYDQRKIHVDLYCKYFEKTQLIISDDFVYATGDAEDRQRMHHYVLGKGIGYRDDSILVDYYVRAYSDTFTVRTPELFPDASRRGLPNVLELQHYGAVRRDGNWLVREGSSAAKHGRGKLGADYFRGAMDLLRATYIGYHGDAQQWLTENPDLTVELLNRCGYWYFLHTVQSPESCKRGTSLTVKMVWENRGVAPAFHAYRLLFRLQGPQTVDVDLESGNRAWTPLPEKKTHAESYQFDLPETLKAGQYLLKAKLYCPWSKRDVLLALSPKLLDDQDFYSLGDITVIR